METQVSEQKNWQRLQKDFAAALIQKRTKQKQKKKHRSINLNTSSIKCLVIFIDPK